MKESAITAQLTELLEQSQAADTFKKAVLAFAEGHDSALISYSAGSPRIKVLRVLMKLLEAYPDIVISDVVIDGRSSCSGYQGALTFAPDSGKIVFRWDCAWKARQAGYVTWFDTPDQTRAAKEFGYQCFERFDLVS